jgi:hypothetical protein
MAKLELLASVDIAASSYLPRFQAKRSCDGVLRLQGQGLD